MTSLINILWFFGYGISDQNNPLIYSHRKKACKKVEKFNTSSSKMILFNCGNLASDENQLRVMKIRLLPKHSPKYLTTVFNNLNLLKYLGIQFGEATVAKLVFK